MVCAQWEVIFLMILIFELLIFSDCVVVPELSDIAQMIEMNSKGGMD